MAAFSRLLRRTEQPVPFTEDIHVRFESEKHEYLCDGAVATSMTTFNLINYVHQNDTRGLLAPEGAVQFVRAEVEALEGWFGKYVEVYEEEPLSLGQRLQSVIPPNYNVDHITLTCVSLESYTRKKIESAVKEKAEKCGNKPLGDEVFRRMQLFDCAVHWRVHPRFYYRESGTDGQWYELENAVTLKHRLVRVKLVDELPHGAKSATCETCHEKIAVASADASRGKYSLLHNNCQNYVVTLCEKLGLRGILSKCTFWLRKLCIQRASRHRYFESTPAYMAQDPDSKRRWFGWSSDAFANYLQKR